MKSLMNEEGLRATTNEKIFVAQPMTLDWEQLCLQLEMLERIAKEGDVEALRIKLAEVVPTYKRVQPMKQENRAESTEGDNPEAGSKIYV